MSERTPLEQIDAWERDGTVDVATATRLRASANKTSTDTAIPAATSGGPSAANYAIAVLLLLGGALLFGAWQIWISGLFNGTDDMGLGGLSMLFGGFVSGPSQMLATYLPISALALFGAWLMRRRDGVPGILVAPLLLLVAYGGAMVAQVLAQWLLGYSLNDFEHFDMLRASGISAFSTLSGLGLIALLERLRPGRLLSFGFVSWTFAAAMTLKAVIDSLGSDGFTFWSANQLWSLWWLLPGLLVYLYARRVAGARAAVSRAFGGVLMILAMLLTGIGSGMADGTTVPVGTLITLVVSLALVALALRERVGAYLWASAIGLFGSLSLLNTVYLAAQIGDLGSLLLEGALLIGIGGVILALRSRLLGGAPASSAAGQ